MSANVHVHRKLPDTEVYGCSKKEAKAVFEDVGELEIHFGEQTHFEFHKGVHHPPALAGTVVASMTVDRDGGASLAFYPIRKLDFAEHEHLELVEHELTHVREWLVKETGLPETQVVANRQFVLESVVDGFRHHEVQFR